MLVKFRLIINIKPEFWIARRYSSTWIRYKLLFLPGGFIYIDEKAQNEISNILWTFFSALWIHNGST